MGASGDINIIDLSKFSFEEMKQTMLSKLSDLERSCYPRGWGFETNYEKIFFDVCKFKNVDDLINYFGTEIHDHCPSEAGVYINGHFYDNWVEQKMPQLIMGNLVLYETDQQDEHYNLPSYLLSDFIGSRTEIWT